MTIMNYIREYINGIDYRVPFYTNDIYEYVARRIPNAQKDVVNAYIARYIKNCTDIVRYQKGIYYKTIKTPFGQVGISYPELIKRAYITEGEKVFGYETGPSFMNKIGLTTQMPNFTYIATEKNRVKVVGDNERLQLIKPVTNVTKNNFRYLQFLDIIDNPMNVKIEAENSNQILREYIDKYKLGFEHLLYYVNYYKNDKIYAKIAGLARSES